MTVIKMSFHIDKSPIHGNGLFASEGLEGGDFITKTHFFMKNYHRKIGNGWVNIKPDCMYNHSEKPNCISKTERTPDGQLQKNLYATTTIVEGQELLVDFRKDKDLEQPEEDWRKQHTHIK